MYNIVVMRYFKNFFYNAKEGLLVLFYSFKDKRTPFYAKIITLIAALYLVSPIDIIPDAFFPAGLIDDIALVPSLLCFAYKVLPKDVVAQARAKAGAVNKTVNKSIIILFIAAAAALLLFVIVLYFLYKLIF